jgi:hypothetical protein
MVPIRGTKAAASVTPKNRKPDVLSARPGIQISNMKHDHAAKTPIAQKIRNILSIRIVFIVELKGRVYFGHMKYADGATCGLSIPPIGGLWC